MPLPSLNRTLFRKIKYTSGRILQADELIRQQDIDQANGSRGLGSLYRNGATLNTVVSITGTQVTLSPRIVGKPMLVFLNGTFEPFTASTMTLTPKSAGSRDYIYCNYTLWRVTQDGDSGNTIVDPTLADQTTGEPTSEVGQLEIRVNTVSEHGTVDPVQMVDRNTVPIVMFALEWAAGNALSQVLPLNGVTTITNPITSSVEQIDPVHAQALASNTAAGLVFLSVSGTGVAVADNDPRMTAGRTPLDATVNTQKVKAPDASGSAVFTYPAVSGSSPVTTTFGGVEVSDAAGGINANRVFWSDWSAKLSDTLGLFWAQITNLLGWVRSHETRIGVLEGLPGSQGGHTGQNLGLPNTHPAVVDATVSGSNTAFRTLVAGGKPDNSTTGAFAVIEKATGNVVGVILDNGDYQIVKDVAALGFASGSNTVRDNTVVGTSPSHYGSLRTLARLVKAHLENHPAGGAGGTLAGDVNGSAGSNQVSKFRGIDISGLPSSVSGLTGQQLVVFDAAGSTYRLAFDPSGFAGGGNAMVIYDRTNNQFALSAIPSGGGAVTLGGDVTGSPTNNTVSRWLNKALDTAAPANWGGQFYAYDKNTDKFVLTPAAQPQTGEVLVYDRTLNSGRGGLKFGAAASGAAGASIPANGNSYSRQIVGPNAGQGRSMSYTVIQFGNMRIAFGSGDLKDGDQIPVPSDNWNSQTQAGTMGWYQAQLSPVVQADQRDADGGVKYSQTQLQLNTVNYNSPEVVINVLPANSGQYTRARQIPTANFFARVFIVAIGFQPANQGL